MDQNRIPLYDALVQFKGKHPISFHVPGHKNGLLLNNVDDFGDFLQFDVTELTGLDNLHSPEGPIMEAQQLLASYYGAMRSYFLVNGSTVGNLVMVLSVFNEGDTVFVQRNCHKSILNALILAKVKPIFLSPEIDSNMRVPGGVDPSVVKDAYISYPYAKGCILTYPNYYGMTYSLKEIIDIIHFHNGFVLVDEAHGPHFRLGNFFPKSALALGADMVVHSAHKMLPAMTMGSYLHINDKKVSLDRVEFYLSALQSSSPSYPIMLSLDIARSFLANFSLEDLDYTLCQRDKFIKGLKQLVAKQPQDPLKVCLRLEGYSGYQLQQIVEEQNVFTEMADPYQVVFVLPLLNEGEKYPYQQAIEKIKIAISRKPIIDPPFSPIPFQSDYEKISSLELSYGEMKNKPFEWVDFNKSINRISAKMITPYPPGIPHLLAGEKITVEKMEQLKTLISLRAKFQGDIHLLNKGKVAVFID